MFFRWLHCIYKFCCFKVLPLFFLLLLTFLFIYRWAFNYLGSVLCYFGHLNLYRYDAHFLLDSNIYIYKYIKLSRKKKVPGVQVVTVCSRPTVLLPLGYLAPIFFGPTVLLPLGYLAPIFFCNDSTETRPQAP